MTGDDVVKVFFGWLLAGIAERIRRPYRRRDLMSAEQPSAQEESPGAQQWAASLPFSFD